MPFNLLILCFGLYLLFIFDTSNCQYAQECFFDVLTINGGAYLTECPVALSSLASDSFCSVSSATPPRITNHPPTEISYKVGEDATLVCEANGQPPPSYEWRKNGLIIPSNGSDSKYRRQPNTGTIVITQPISADEGVYQCFARNKWGTAVSIKTSLKKAVLDPFPSIKQPKIHRPYVGTSFFLKCDPPKSYPPGLVYWGENKPGSRLKPIENTERISSDYSGNLYFSNIHPEDYLRGLSYICIVQNTALRSLVQGDDQAIHPINITDTPGYEPPQLMWSSLTQTVAIRGQSMKMKCIFSGYPTPKVTWERRDNPMSAAAGNTSFGQEIVIGNVQFDDEGSYRCSATNTENGSPVFKDFQLVVESTPYWRQEQPPEDVVASEDEPAQIQCFANGKPRPTVSWSINGQPVEELPPDPRRTVTEHMLSYTSVTKRDVQVIQCNASNVHGYILANAYINVLAEAPSFIRTPSASLKVAEGSNVTLTCRVFGAPKPKIVWKYSETEEQVLTGERFVQQSTGDLLIKGLVKNDSGQYVCEASNKFGTDSVRGMLIVRERTVITNGPKDQVVNASSTVIFPCKAETDDLESSNLAIEWRINGEKIDYARRPHLEHNKQNNSLIITGVEASDSANYTCHAANGVDHTDATARLVVRDRPDPPSNVVLVNACLDNKAELKWTPGSDNNDRIIEYIVYCNTSHDPPDRFKSMVHVPESSSHKSVLNLFPWTTYSFHVTARNSLGESQRSHFTSEFRNCSTPSAMPFRHPKEVCTVSRKEDELVIVWQPMEAWEHNGENFHYVVGYKKKGGQDTKISEISDWRANEIVIPHQPTFTEYEIFVKSVNSKGEAPGSTLQRRIGYSGQGLPLSKPENFAVLSFNSSSANFTWNEINEHSDEVKGFFLGYRIKFWKTGHPEHFRTEDMILRTVDPCPPLTRKRRRDAGKAENKPGVTGHTNKLWAFSDITAVVMVLNGARHTGPESNSIEFKTPEGVPEAVTKFEVTERGSNHFVVTWNPPEEPNGILTGYVIEFEEAPSGVILNKVDVDPSVQSKKITGLKNDTNYVVHIRAKTSAGNSPDIQLQEKTNPSSVPSKPGIGSLEVGDDFVLVSWKPYTENENTQNPGSFYCVEYRPEGSEEWMRTSNITDNSQINVTGLEKGVKYEVCVVAFNADDKHSKSDVVTATTGPKTDHAKFDTAGSFLHLVVLGAILFLVIFILCFFCYVTFNKGGSYLVNEREKKNGCAAGKDDEPEFGEYVRPQEPYMSKSSSSINSLSAKKPLDPGDSDNDSLGEYADPDPSKFNEDGSFIGQYGNKKNVTTKEAPMAAFSTYI